VAIDGMAMRGSVDGVRSALHMVSVFSTQLGLVLRQERMDGKNNEITAIPELLKALYVKGFLSGLDLMGCQREIAQKIRGKGCGYLLAVKGSQHGLYDEFAG
jgi:hypothetical protein